MTGRKYPQLDSSDWGDSDVLLSLSHVKPTLIKRINFNHLPSRPSKPKKPLNYSSSYDCNYNSVKPAPHALINFASAKGR